jgi:alpha/beta superfamily hydrolase
MLDQEPSKTPVTVREHPFYLRREGEQLYHVFHDVPSPRGAVLLVGPFPTERPYAYTPWVRWARYLASSGVAALRFDYRAAGESTGQFVDASIATWVADAHDSLSWLRTKIPGVSIVIHGLGFGALIASQVASAVAAPLLLWSAPNSAEEAMKEILMRRLSADFKIHDGKRKSWEDYVRELENDGCVNVQGYPISGRLWREATALAATARLGNCAEQDRPFCSVKLGRRAAPLVAGIGQWRAMDPNMQTGRVPLEPDLNWLFAETVLWIDDVLRREARAHP